jgi:hypothetical protein
MNEAQTAADLRDRIASLNREARRLQDRGRWSVADRLLSEAEALADRLRDVQAGQERQP